MTATRTPRPARDRLLTVREVASMYRVSPMTVYRLTQSGELSSTRVGRSIRIRASDAVNYVNDGFTQGHGAA